MSRDVLSDLASGAMTLDEVYAFHDAVMESDALKIDAELGLSRREWTAFGHGVGFAELAQWRAEGWLSQCQLCGEPMVLDVYGWLAQESAEGTHRLVHVSCPGQTRCDS
jgi:hypothetical protein